jgi:hypothetical protein
MKDARSRTLAGFIAALEIFAKHTEKGLEQKYFLGGEHDVIYIYVSSEDCPDNSADGNKLVSLGWRVDTDTGNWMYYC